MGVPRRINPHAVWDKHWLDASSKLYGEGIAGLNLALARGYSVVELKRIFSMKHCRKLYNAMRDASLLQKLPNKRWPNKDNVPQGLIAALKAVDLGMPQWCNGRIPAIPVPVMIAGLSRELQPDNPDSVAAHKAFFLDFPSVYEKAYGQKMPGVDLYISPLKSSVERLTYVVKPHPVMGYLATAILEGIGPWEEHGDNASKALTRLIATNIIINGIKKLKLLPSRS